MGELYGRGSSDDFMFIFLVRVGLTSSCYYYLFYFIAPQGPFFCCAWRGDRTSELPLPALVRQPTRLPCPCLAPAHQVLANAYIKEVPAVSMTFKQKNAGLGALSVSQPATRLQGGPEAAACGGKAAAASPALRPQVRPVHTHAAGPTSCPRLQCMVGKCGGQIYRCVSDTQCKAALDCLQACEFNDQGGWA